MIVEADYLLSRERLPEEYIKHLTGLISDLKEFNFLLNNLLELAHVNRDNNIQLSAVRIDEIIYDAIHQVKNRYPGRKIIPKIQYTETETDLLINGNSGLLTIAIKNLIENACKFSDNDVIIDFHISDKLIKVTITDKGIGIPPDELDSIYKPFKRASNVRFKGGFGIGLSLVSQIMELHDVDLKVFSTVNEGTKFELIFKKLN